MHNKYLYFVIKRLFDLVTSIIVLIITSPVLILVGLIIFTQFDGPIFFRQIRIGKFEKEITIYKFRSMKNNTDFDSKITSKNDQRVTKFGTFIRRYKIDELPQLFNVIAGNMSIVGPRPENGKFISLLSDEDKIYYKIKPGITSPASIVFRNENDLIQENDAESFYVNEILPIKTILNNRYYKEMSFSYDLKIIFATAISILFKSKMSLKDIKSKFLRSNK